MSLFFNDSNQLKILLKYLPSGKAYTQAFAEASNFHKLMKWIASLFDDFIAYINGLFRARFFCESNLFVDRGMKDYLIPNDIFYRSSNPNENNVDLFVLKYLMKGNTEWHFQAIANIYGFDVAFGKGSGKYPPGYDPPADREDHNVFYVTFFKETTKGFAYDFPFAFGDPIGNKIKKIYDIIKEAQINIVYLLPKYRIEIDYVYDYLPGNVPYPVGRTEEERIIYEDAEDIERIKFCIGL